MLAYLNDPAVKKTFLARVENHRKADQLVQGYGYWKDGKGCAVGCTIHGENHADYETELGVPRALARLEDIMFERMPKTKAELWPSAFLEAIPVGADLSLVITEFMIWLLVDEKDGVIHFARAEGKVAIERVAALLRRKMAGDNPTADEWTAEAAAAAAARWTAAAAAAEAAEAEAAAAAAAFWIKASAKLLKIIRSREPRPAAPDKVRAEVE